MQCARQRGQCGRQRHREERHAGQLFHDHSHVGGVVRRLLKKMGRDPNAIIELWTPPQADIAATMALEDDWTMQSVKYLRTLIAD